MDAGPGTDLGGLGWFLGLWTTMMAAMMLPAVAPVAIAYAQSPRGHASTVVFVTGYLATWAFVGALAYALFRVLERGAPSAVAWDRRGPFVAGAALVAAGLYQLTPLKDVCLRHCRSPLHFLVHRWRAGRLGAARMGAHHAAYCVGCCAGLMLALFALGVMSLVWMAVVASVILVEKVAPRGESLSRAFAVALVALGALVAVAPDTVPGLGDPTAPTPMMDMTP